MLLLEHDEVVVGVVLVVVMVDSKLAMESSKPSPAPLVHVVKQIGIVSNHVMFGNDDSSDNLFVKSN
jgi:hypothetical protein